MSIESAVELRQAAALMRERASAVTPGHGARPAPHWFARRTPSSTQYEIAGGGAIVLDRLPRRELAEHVASWNPAVVLAVADWLDLVASYEEQQLDDVIPAHRLARVYLGEPA